VVVFPFALVHFPSPKSACTPTPGCRCFHAEK
jgi:hypothetical protein